MALRSKRARELADPACRRGAPGAGAQFSDEDGDPGTVCVHPDLARRADAEACSAWCGGL